MIERHLRVKDLGGASGLLPNTPFILLTLDLDTTMEMQGRVQLGLGPSQPLV